MASVQTELPLVYDALIGERDAYMAANLRSDAIRGKTVVGVVGIAHMDGIERELGYESVPCGGRGIGR